MKTPSGIPASCAKQVYRYRRKALAGGDDSHRHRSRAK